MRISVPWALVVSALVVLGGTAQVAASARVPLEWAACGDDRTAECATLEGPLDAADPRSRAVQLPVRRVRATDPAVRIGTLVTIAGGPGQRGTEWVRPGLHTAAIHERFDIVSWDPRGTSSDSAVDCIPEWDPYQGLDRSPDDALERSLLDERTATLASRCRQAHGDLLPFLGTVHSALDLERLRLALREEHLTLLGVSYGSRLALTYATLFPERVSAIVLDGYADPNQSPAGRQLEQAEAFERELDAVLGECASDRACPLALGGTPAEALDALLAGLDEASLVDPDGAWTLSQSDAYEAIAGSLLWGGAARDELLVALASAAAGDGAALADIAYRVRSAYEASGLTMGAFTAIECADDGAYWETLDENAIDALTQRIHAVAPRLGRWLWSPPTDPDLPPVGLCAMLPFYLRTQLPVVDAAGAGPVLVLATSGDPTTPASAAGRALADLEEAVLLELEADHHLAYHAALASPAEPRNACVLDAVESYLIEHQLPPADYACG